MVSPGTGESAAPEVPLWRLNVLRAIALLFVVSNLVKFPEMLLYASATDRGMIKAFLTGLWLMSFLAVRYPLKMLPLFLFEFAWKTVWLLAFGLPQWLGGIGSPQLGRDLIEIASPRSSSQSSSPGPMSGAIISESPRSLGAGRRTRRQLRAQFSRPPHQGEGQS